MTLESLVIVTLALGCGALAKGATGMGLPLVALPILATVLGLPHAIAVLFFPILLTNAWQVWAYREHRHGLRFLPMFMGTGVVGIAVGTVFLANLSPEGLKLAMAALLFAYVGLRFARPNFGLAPAVWRPVSAGAGLAAGVVQGATGISSPVLATFLLSLRLSREGHVFAISTMFLLFAATQLPALAVAGMVRWPMLLESAVAMLPVVVMMPVGNWLAKRFGEKLFDRAVMAMLIFMGGRFLLEGLGIM